MITHRTWLGISKINCSIKSDTPHTALQDLLRDTDIEDLKHRISDIQANLLELARRRGQTQRRARTNHVYLSRRKMPRTTRASSDESTTQTKRAS